MATDNRYLSTDELLGILALRGIIDLRGALEAAGGAGWPGGPNEHKWNEALPVFGISAEMCHTCNGALLDPLRREAEEADAT